MQCCLLWYTPVAKQQNRKGEGILQTERWFKCNAFVLV